MAKIKIEEGKESVRSRMKILAALNNKKKYKANKNILITLLYYNKESFYKNKPKNLLNVFHKNIIKVKNVNFNCYHHSYELKFFVLMNKN